MYKMLETLRVTLIRVEIQELHAVRYNMHDVMCGLASL